jgi:ribosomal protein L17
MGSRAKGGYSDGVEMNEKVIANMQGRIMHLRRLTQSLTDERTIQTLLSMAKEIEADAERLKRDSRI